MRRVTLPLLTRSWRTRRYEAPLRRGLRHAQATGANIEQLGMERGHRTLTVLRKGAKTVTMPMSPRTARGCVLRVVWFALLAVVLARMANCFVRVVAVHSGCSGRQECRASEGST